MPQKRKHQGSSNDGSTGSEPIYSKRPRKSAGNQSELAQTIYDIVKDYRDDKNHLISEYFMKLPSKRHHPDYYEKVIDPLDLSKIAQRIKADEYRDIEILTTDFQLMTSNAKKYYEQNSQEYKDACALWEVFISTKSKLLEENKPSEPSKSKVGKKPKARSKIPDDQESDNEDVEMNIADIKEVYEGIVTETDEDGRLITDIFLQLPDPSNDQYYEVIKDPIDFIMIGEKLENGQYKSMSEFRKDVLLLVKNAKTFNEPHSQIYQDAVSIKNILREKIEDLERSKRPDMIGAKSSARVKNRKSFGRTSERLQEKSTTKIEESKLDLHEASILNPSEYDYQALFYNEVVNYRNQIGHTISDPFVRLPNKRFYPMYYDDIENPISLKMIRKKVMSKKYENCEELAEDLNLLFSNAKQFNVGTSQIHKDAANLQKFMESKLPEFSAKEEEDMEEVSGSEEEEEENKVQSEDKVAEGESKDAAAVPLPKKKKRKRLKSTRESLQTRLQLLYNTLMEAEDDAGREMILLFLEKPSKKDYPDYYKLVLEPIDMKMIEKKIRHDKYSNVQDMLEDFDLMFNNARHYNEPGSEVYRDADALEKLLLEKNKELGPLPEFENNSEKQQRPSKKSSVSETEEKLEKLFSAVRDYTDPTHRMICDIFMHLPTKQVLPDYYKVIKKPIDMDRIQLRMQTNQYMRLDEMLADLLLMFENACVYNEPGSVIYKDALILQKVAVDTFYQLEKQESILSPEDLVQEMLISLFMSVVNHQDDGGRCYSDSFTGSSMNTEEKREDSSTGPAQEASDPAAPVPMETDEGSKASTKLSFEIIKKNLHNRRYRRLDVFQDHMFEVFEDARNNNRTDSEVYEDAVELQKFFIKIRDELCKNGETLMSPALSLTGKRLENEFEAERKEKQPEESKEDDKMTEEGKEMREKLETSAQSDGMDFKGTFYKPGDFVYIENPENPSSPHIVNIEKLYTDETGQSMLYGLWLYRPEATFHMASKKFFVKEVFKSDYYNAVPVALIQGKCFVMLSKDYFKMKPVGFKEEDVYVAESRYLSKAKSFKRLKLNQWPHSSTELVPRDAPLPVIRISSCYSEQKAEDPNVLDKIKTMLMHDIEESWPTDPIAVERKNIEADGPVFGEAKHYIQYFTGTMWVKLGDCVYIEEPNSSKTKIARIERLWVDQTGKIWFHGPWFIRPEDTEHEPTRMFYKNELFISCSEETFRFEQVVKKCMVLCLKDYFACRPTEMPEEDIYLFESKYILSEQMIKKIKSAKRYTPTYKVVDDEYYYYKRPLQVETVLSPYLIKVYEEEMADRENEAKSAIIKPEIEESSSVASPMPSFSQPPPSQPHVYPAPPPVQPQYGQPLMMLPSQPYPQYSHQMVQGYPGSPAQVDPRHPGIPSPYMQQPYQTGPQYPHPGVPPQHIPQYHQTPPHGYPQSPHGTHPPMMIPSPGVQSAEDSRSSSTHTEVAPTPPPPPPPPPTTTKRRGRCGHSTGYILFASFYHPKARAEHPEMPFGEISKIVGEEWRKLEDEKKREYEEKAKEQTARLEAEGKLVAKRKKKKKEAVEEAPQPTPKSTPQHPVVSSATPQPYGPPAPNQYQPTPGQPHISPRMPMAHPGASPQTHPMTSYGQTPVGHPYPQQIVVPPQPPPPSIAQEHRAKRGPLFLQPPPKAQRVMHSEAYLRYIEGLEKGSRSISNWEKTLKVQESDVQLSKEEEKKLPVHWLENGKGRHESATSALWALRDLMLKDALAIKSSFSFN